MAPELSADELVVAYEKGRRDFAGLNLRGISFPLAYEHGKLKRVLLAEADFSYVDLRDSRLTAIDAPGASFRNATWRRATVFSASLAGSDLRNVSFGDARLNRVDFEGADARRTRFSLASLNECRFGRARLDDARLGHTQFSAVDLGSACGAALVHEGPSTIDARTVMRSYRHPRLKSFMIDCGVPEVFAEYMIECARALGDDLLKELMQSTFISYGGPDEAFARRLNDALRAYGVVTFFFPETAKVGERIGNEVFRALQRHDRMILVCSRASLDRPGVLNEIQETLDREARDGGAAYLIPVRLDDYLFEEWSETQPALAMKVKSRVAADFRDPASFDEGLARLLDALKKRTPRAT